MISTSPPPFLRVSRALRGTGFGSPAACAPPASRRPIRHLAICWTRSGARPLHRSVRAESFYVDKSSSRYGKNGSLQSRPSTTVNFPLGRIARFGSTASVRSNASRPRTSSPSWHLPILSSYSSKSWLVPRVSLQIYCTAKAVGKTLALAAIVLRRLMTTLQERLMPKLSSSCSLVVSLARRARIGERYS